MLKGLKGTTERFSLTMPFTETQSNASLIFHKDFYQIITKEKHKYIHSIFQQNLMDFSFSVFFIFALLRAMFISLATLSM